MPPKLPRYLGFASKLEKNTERAEDLFKKGSGFGTRVGRKRPGATSQQPQIEPEPRDEGPKRRPTRSTNEIPPEWIKLPVEVPYLDPESGECMTVEGVVYYSIDSQKLYKKQKGLVYMEGAINGNASILSIEEAHLPMMTEEHPAYQQGVNRLKKERKGRVDHAKRVRELQLHNEDSWHDADVRMANQTYERDVEHLRSTMLEAANRKLSTLKQMMEKKPHPTPTPRVVARADKAGVGEPTDDVTTDESEGEAIASASTTTPAVSPEEEARARKTLESTLLSKPTVLQSQPPWAPLWDKLQEKKSRRTSLRERGRRGAKEEVDYVRDEEYVDILSLARRRAGLEDY